MHIVQSSMQRADGPSFATPDADLADKIAAIILVMPAQKVYFHLEVGGLGVEKRVTIRTTQDHVEFLACLLDDSEESDTTTHALNRISPVPRVGWLTSQ